MYLNVFSVILILLYQCLIGVNGALSHNPFRMGVPTLTDDKMHCNIVTKSYHPFRVVVLPALKDNFMYLLIDKSTNEAAVVDPVEPNVVWEAVHKENVTLTTVLTTHHHWDHAGGNKELLEKNQSHPITVVGGDESIEGLSFMIKKPEVEFRVGSLTVKALRTPCHTEGHVCYYVSAGGQDGVVFTGDTLFYGGCGKFFEGSAREMYDSLVNKLARLPDKTDVYCGHEYTVQNLLFALQVEPYNQDIIHVLKDVGVKRKSEDPSVPSTIAIEKKINPFMRVEKEKVQEFTKTIGDPIETMRLLREIKNNS